MGAALLRCLCVGYDGGTGGVAAAFDRCWQQSEAKKTRPAVVVNESNRSKSIVQVVPCTSKKTDRANSFETPVTIDGGVSKAQADQIRTVHQD